MFFLHNLERRVTLHPSYFGKNMLELVTTKLLRDVEGTCANNYFIISIMDTFNISEGRVLPGSGLAEFIVGYRAVVWRPFNGETVCLPREQNLVHLSTFLANQTGRHHCELREPTRCFRRSRASLSFHLFSRRLHSEILPLRKPDPRANLSEPS